MKYAATLKRRTALVTGASKGLGVFFAERLAASGVRVAVAARRLNEREQVCSRIRDAGGEAMALALDVTDSRSAEAVIAAVVKAWGDLDILVNNAGVTGTAPPPLPLLRLGAR